MSAIINNSTTSEITQGNHNIQSQRLSSHIVTSNVGPRHIQSQGIHKRKFEGSLQNRLKTDNNMQSMPVNTKGMGSQNQKMIFERDNLESEYGQRGVSSNNDTRMGSQNPLSLSAFQAPPQNDSPTKIDTSNGQSNSSPKAFDAIIQYGTQVNKEYQSSNSQAEATNTQHQVLTQRIGVYKTNLNTAFAGKPILASAIEAMVDHKVARGSSNKRSHGSRDNRFMMMSSVNQASKTQYQAKVTSLTDQQESSITEKFVKPGTVRISSTDPSSPQGNFTFLKHFKIQPFENNKNQNKQHGRNNKNQMSACTSPVKFDQNMLLSQNNMNTQTSKLDVPVSPQESQPTSGRLLPIANQTLNTLFSFCSTSSKEQKKKDRDLLDSQNKFQIEHFEKLVKPNLRPAGKSYLTDKLDRLMKERHIEEKRRKWEERMVESKRLFLLSQGRQATEGVEGLKLNTDMPHFPLPNLDRPLSNESNEIVRIQNNSQLRANSPLQQISVIDHLANTQNIQMHGQVYNSTQNNMTYNNVSTLPTHHSVIITKEPKSERPQFVSKRNSTSDQQNLTQTTFNFGNLGEDKYREIPLPIAQSVKERAISPKSKPNNEKIFVVNKKSRSSVVNQRSCFSKQTILLSHGDTYREIYEFTNKINQSLQRHYPPQNPQPEVPQPQQTYGPSFKDLPQPEGKQVQQSYERIINNGLKVTLNPRNLVKYENFKKKDKQSSELDHINMEVQEVLPLLVQMNDFIKLHQQEIIKRQQQIISKDESDLSPLISSDQEGRKSINSKRNSVSKENCANPQASLHINQMQFDQAYQQKDAPVVNIRNDKRTTIVSYDSNHKKLPQPQRSMDARVQEVKKAHLAEHLFSPDRSLSRKDASTSNPIINKDQIGIQNLEDLEKIKEDSAESFLDPNNQMGMIMKNQGANQGRQKSMFDGVGVLSSIKTDLLPVHDVHPEVFDDSSTPNLEKRSSQTNIRVNPSRVVLSKKQYDQKGGIIPNSAKSNMQKTQNAAMPSLSQNFDLSADQNIDDVNGTLNFQDEDQDNHHQNNLRENRYMQADSQYIKNSNLSYYDSKDQQLKQNQITDQGRSMNKNNTIQSKQESHLVDEMKFKTENSIQSKEAIAAQYSQKSFGIEPIIQSQMNLQSPSNNQISAVVNKVQKTSLTIENPPQTSKKKKHFGQRISNFQICLKEDLNQESFGVVLSPDNTDISNEGEIRQLEPLSAQQFGQKTIYQQKDQMNSSFGMKFQWKDKKPLTQGLNKRVKTSNQKIMKFSNQSNEKIPQNHDINQDLKDEKVLNLRRNPSSCDNLISCQCQDEHTGTCYACQIHNQAKQVAQIAHNKLPTINSVIQNSGSKFNNRTSINSSIVVDYPDKQAVTDVKINVTPPLRSNQNFISPQRAAMLSKTHYQRQALAKPHAQVHQQQQFESFESRQDADTGVYGDIQNLIELQSFEAVRGNLLKENHQRIKRGITSPAQKNSIKKPSKEERLMFPLPTTIQAELNQTSDKKQHFGIICKAGRTLASFN